MGGNGMVLATGWCVCNSAGSALFRHTRLRLRRGLGRVADRALSKAPKPPTPTAPPVGGVGTQAHGAMGRGALRRGTWPKAPTANAATATTTAAAVCCVALLMWSSTASRGGPPALHRIREARAASHRRNVGCLGFRINGHLVRFCRASSKTCSATPTSVTAPGTSDANLEESVVPGSSAGFGPNTSEGPDRPAQLGHVNLQHIQHVLNMGLRAAGVLRIHPISPRLRPLDLRNEGESKRRLVRRGTR